MNSNVKFERACGWCKAGSSGQWFGVLSRKGECGCLGVKRTMPVALMMQ